MRIAYRIAALAVVLALLGALGYDYSRLRGELKTAREATKTAQEGEQKVRTVVVYRERLRVTTAAETASMAASAAVALAANRAWADEPVPQEVQDALAP